MKPSSLEFRHAASVVEAIEIVASFDGVAKYLAGGQTLGPMINLRLAQPDLIVDISRIEELRQTAEKNDHLRIGSAVTHAEIEDGRIPDVTQGLMREVASMIAYRAVRNRGTIGGSLAHADPSAEWVSSMLALNATVSLRSADSERRIDVGELIYAPMMTTLGIEEIIESINVPRLSKSAKWGFAKKNRKVGEFASAMAVVISDPERKFHSAVVGGHSCTPQRMPETSHSISESLTWKQGREKEILRAYEVDLASSKRVIDEYDRHVLGLTLVRAVREALAT